MVLGFWREWMVIEEMGHNLVAMFCLIYITFGQSSLKPRPFIRTGLKKLGDGSHQMEYDLGTHAAHN
jgi:hypothetical protein